MAACCVVSSFAFVVTSTEGDVSHDWHETDGLGCVDGEPEMSRLDPAHTRPAAAKQHRANVVTKIGLRKSAPSKANALARARLDMRNFSVPSRPLRVRRGMITVGRVPPRPESVTRGNGRVSPTRRSVRRGRGAFGSNTVRGSDSLRSPCSLPPSWS